MPVYKYPPVSVTTKRTAACPVCGKKATRSWTVTHTVSPFNVNEDGRPRTATEVRAQVRAEANAWNPDPSLFTHRACEESRDAE